MSVRCGRTLVWHARIYVRVRRLGTVMPDKRPPSPLCEVARMHFKKWLDDLLIKSSLDGKDVPCHMFEH